MDEMWSFVSRKANQRWLWHAIDHATGQVLAYGEYSKKCATLGMAHVTGCAAVAERRCFYRELKKH